MKVFNKGQQVQIETEVKIKQPFKDYELYDPAQVSLSVVAPSGTEIVNTEMNKSSTGKYYYFFQLPEAAETGVYNVVITTDDGVNGKNIYEEFGFKVIE